MNGKGERVVPQRDEAGVGMESSMAGGWAVDLAEMISNILRLGQSAKGLFGVMETWN